MKNLMLYIVCLILGMLIYNMIKNLSSCKIVEGGGEDEVALKFEHIEVRAENPTHLRSGRRGGRRS